MVYKFRSQQQYSYSFNSTTVKNKINFDISAIKVPLLLQYSFNNSTLKVKPFLQAGGWIAFFTSTKSQIDYDITSSGVPSSGTYNNFPFNSNNFGYILSAGADIPVNKVSAIRLALRYEGGTGIHSSGDNQNSQARGLSGTKGFSIQVGYIF